MRNKHLFTNVGLISFAFLLIGSCASEQKVRSGIFTYQSDPFPTLVETEPHPETTAILHEFYAYQGDHLVENFKTRTDTLLQRFPNHFEVHEVAAFVHLLSMEHDIAWNHFRRAALDKRADLTRLYLAEMNSLIRTVAMYAQEIPTLKELARSHPSPDIRSQASVMLRRDLQRFGLEDTGILSDAFGTIDQWSFIGPFDNDQGKGLFAVYPPEGGYDPKGEYAGSRSPIQWRPVILKDTTELELRNHVYPWTNSLAYAATWIWSDTETQARFSVTTQSAVRAWLNNQSVLEVSRLDDSITDNLQYAITLQKGWNQILVKTAHKTGLWKFGARITQLDGKAIPGLRVTNQMQKVTPDPTSREPHELLLSTLEADDPATRERFARVSLLKKAGFTKRALRELEQANKVAPSHPLLVEWWASLLATNDEKGKAIDLLQNTLTNQQEETPSLLYARARFFIEKKRWEKGVSELLRITTKTDGSLLSELKLAQVYEERGWKLDRYMHLRETAKRWPSSGAVKRDLADALLAMGRTEQAFQILEGAVKEEPGHVWGRDKYCSLLAKRNQQKAVLCAQEMVHLHPASIPYRNKLAIYQIAEENFSEAQKTLRHALAQRPEGPFTLELLGRIAYEEQRTEEALDYWSRSLVQYPDDTKLASLVARLSNVKDELFQALGPSEADIDQAIELRHQMMASANVKTAYLMDDSVTVVNADGSSRRVVTMIVMATNEQGRDNLIKVRIPSTRTKLHFAYTIAPDGTRREASSVRGGEIRFRQLDVGSVVAYQYLYHAPGGAFLPNHFTDSFNFQGFLRSFIQSRWVLVLDKDRPLKIHQQGVIQHETRLLGDKTVHTFSSKRLPALVPEKAMPSTRETIARAAVSTLVDWNEYVEWERALLMDAFQETPEMARLALELTAQGTSKEDKFYALYQFVTEEIRYQQDYENTIAGVKPHTGPVVIQRGYGDCKDKAVLLRTLAKVVGIDVHFALVRTRNKGPLLEEVPSQQFNHAIAYIPKQDGFEKGFFADPTTNGLYLRSLRQDDQGTRSLVLNPTNGAWSFIDIPFQPAEEAFENITIEIDPTTATPTADISIVTRGMDNGQLRTVMKNKSLWPKIYQGLSNYLFPGSNVISGEIQNHDTILEPLIINLQVQITPAVHLMSDGTRIDTPFSFLLESSVPEETRAFDILLGIKKSSSLSISIKREKGQRFLMTPGDYAITHDCFQATRKTSVTKTHFQLNSNFKLECPRVPQSDYAEFRRAAQQVIQHKTDPLVISTVK